MALQNSITRDNLEIFVTLFYKNALLDKHIGYFFELEFGYDMQNEEWAEHIALLVNFWDSIFLNKNAYNGDPFGPHFTMVNIKLSHFHKWLALFISTAEEIYTPDIATLFKEKGEFYTQLFIEKMGRNMKNESLTTL